MQLFDLTGKTALIPSASSGFGEQFSHCPSSASAHVILAARKEIVKKIPLGFRPDSTDLDWAILYLAFNQVSRRVTGAIFTIDGGIS